MTHLIAHIIFQTIKKYILAENFDWRLCKHSKFGQGIYFATNAYYASHYPFDADEEDKVIIVVKVLVCNSLTLSKAGRHNSFSVPPANYDSTKNEDGQVLVKYDDNEFYPAYVVWYKKIDKEPLGTACPV